MIAFALVIAHFALGVVFAVVVFRRGGTWFEAVLHVPLWPLLVASTLQPRAPPAGPPLSANPSFTLAEREAVSRFERHLEARRAQLLALRQLRLKSPGRASHAAALEQTLARALAEAEALFHELEDRVALAEVAAIAPDAGAVDRVHVEALLACAEALAQASLPADGGVAGPDTAPLSDCPPAPHAQEERRPSSSRSALG